MSNILLTGIALDAINTSSGDDAIDEHGNPIKIGVSVGTMVIDASVGDGAMRHYIGSILHMARKIGLSFPSEEVIFRSGQVFFEAGVPVEVRISLSCRNERGSWHAFQRTRMRDGTEHARGPVVAHHPGPIPIGEATPPERDPLEEADRGRCHITASGIRHPDAIGGIAIAVAWDLRDNARIVQTGGGEPVPDIMRVPQGLLVATTSVRSGRIEAVERAFPSKGTFPIDPDMALWTVIPSEGTALLLPFEDASGVTVATVQGRAHMVLSGGLLMSYLTTWALWGMHPDAAGRFLVSTGEIAELRGWPRLSGGRAGAGGTTYGRPMTEFRGHVRTLEGYGIKATSEIKARSAEPLIQFYEHRSGSTYYRHAPILVDTILAQAGRQEPGGFAQVPVRALRLGARDGAAIYGLSAFWRRGAAAEWQGTLRELATEIGCFSANEARKRGRAYWLDLASELARIVRDGGFGALHVGGADPGPDAPCTLTPSPELESAYVRLHEARERARAKTESVEHEAAVRRKLPPARRRPRRPGS